MEKKGGDGQHRLISKHRKGIKLEASLEISPGIPSLIRDARFDPDADRFFSADPLTYGDLTDLTTTPVPSSLPSPGPFSECSDDKNRGRTVRIDDDDDDVRGDRSAEAVAGDEPRVSISRNALSRTSRMEPSERHADDF